MKKFYILLVALFLVNWAKAQWIWQNPLSTGNLLLSVYFIDSNNGYIVGDAGTILKTVNGGTSWVSLPCGTSNWLSSVFFTDLNTGFVVDDWGDILKTSDGGTIWTVQSSGTTRSLYGVCFPAANVGYAVGEGGTILKTTNGGGYPSGSNDQVLKANTLKIYPNPVSTSITIETPSKGSFSILNTNGKELLHKEIMEPKTQIDISNLSGGVYFLRLTGERTVEVGKIIKQ